MTLTDNALQALEQMNLPTGTFLRIGIIPGGCSGHTYSATLDDEMFITDLVLYEKEGIRVVTDPDSVEYLAGLEIDYSDDLIRSGFRFSNPNATGCCGCGASFEA